MEGKIITNLIITMSDFDVDEDKKITVVKGYFYFQGKKYLIENKEIYHAQGGING